MFYLTGAGGLNCFRYQVLVRGLFDSKSLCDKLIRVLGIFFALVRFVGLGLLTLQENTVWYLYYSENKIPLIQKVESLQGQMFPSFHICRSCKSLRPIPNESILYLLILVSFHGFVLSYLMVHSYPSVEV